MYQKLEERITQTAASGQAKVSDLMAEIASLKSRLTIASGSAGEVGGCYHG